MVVLKKQKVKILILKIYQNISFKTTISPLVFIYIDRT